jgi:hypothetical protein
MNILTKMQCHIREYVFFISDWIVVFHVYIEHYLLRQKGIFSLSTANINSYTFK